MRRHELQSCKPKQNKDSVGDILNKVVQRANMNVEPIKEKTSSYLKPMTEEPTTLKPATKKPMIPIQAVKALKPKSLTDLAADIEMKSDSEDSDETEEEEEEYEIMPDNPKELKEAFRNLYYKFRRDVGMYNKLVLMLDKLERLNCLTKEECNAMNDHLQKKLETRDHNS